MRRPRSSVLLSFALHAVATAVMIRIAWQPSQTPPAERVSIFWLPTPRPSLLQREPREIEPPRDEETQPQMHPAETAAERADPGGRPGGGNAPPGHASAESASPTNRPTAIDLSEAKRRAIETTLEERERGLSHRSFLFPGTIGDKQAFDESEFRRRQEAGLQVPLTAFDSPSKGRAALSSQVALGELTRWTSDDCYQLLGTNNLFLFGPALGIFSVPANVCVRPTARDDLFKSAKPAYLMDAEEQTEVQKDLRRWER